MVQDSHASQLFKNIRVDKCPLTLDTNAKGEHTRLVRLRDPWCARQGSCHIPDDGVAQSVMRISGPVCTLRGRTSTIRSFHPGSPRPFHRDPSSRLVIPSSRSPRVLSERLRDHSGFAGLIRQSLMMASLMSIHRGFFLRWIGAKVYRTSETVDVPEPTSSSGQSSQQGLDLPCRNTSRRNN